MHKQLCLFKTLLKKKIFTLGSTQKTLNVNGPDFIVGKVKIVFSHFASREICTVPSNIVQKNTTENIGPVFPSYNATMGRC